MAAPAVETSIGTNPYVGPRSFNTGEHLYGRTRESTELKDLLIAERIVLLYSPSGAGKSSLINAALIPSMQKEGFFVAPVLRINLEPPKEAPAQGFNRYIYSLIRSLEETLPEGARLGDSQLMGMKLAAYLPEFRKRAAADELENAGTGSLLFIIDQFEEVLRVSAADLDVKQDLFNQLGELLRTDRSLWALFALREDYLAALGEYTRPIPNRLSVTYRLDFLDARSAIEAIQGPSRDSGVDFKGDAAIALVDSLRKIRVQKPDGTTEEQYGPYVEPVQLQVVCRRLWDKAAAKKEITIADVNEAGNIDEALSDYYAQHVDEATKASGVGERQIREWFDRKLITPIGIRGQVLMEPEVSSGLPNPVIKILQEAYLVRADKRGNAIWFELAHDRLTRPIRRNNSEWFAQHLSVFQRQADFWQLQGKPNALILTGQAYLEAEEWVKEHPEVLTQPGPEKEFLEACREEHKVMVREHRLNQTIRWASLGLLVLTAAAIFLFLNARNLRIEADQRTVEAVAAQAVAQTAQANADFNNLKAEVSGVVVQSAANLTVDPDLSAGQAIGIFDRLDPVKPENASMLSQAEDALRRVLPSMRSEQKLTDPLLSPQQVTGEAFTKPTPIPGSGQDHTFTSVAYDPSGTRWAAGSEDGQLRIWSADNTEEPKTLQVFQPAETQPGVTSVAFSPDGSWLAAAAGNGYVFLYDAENFDATRVPVQTGPIYALAFNAESTRMIVGGAKGLVEILDLADTSKGQALPAGTADVLSVAFSVDGKGAAAGDADGTVFVWDAESAQPRFTLTHAHTGPVSSVAFSPDGSLLATSGSDDRLINLWNLSENGSKKFTISGHRDSVNAVAFTLDGSQLISASSDRTVRLWDTTFGRPGLVLYGHTDQVFALSLSRDGNRLASTGRDLSVRVWNISPEGSREFQTFSFGTPIHDLALSPDGAYTAVAGEDGKVYVTLSRTSTLVAILDKHAALAEAATVVPGSVESVAFSPQGDRIVAADADGMAMIWNADGSGKPLPLEGRGGPVWDAAFSPDGKQVVTANDDGTVILWDAQSGKLLFRFPATSGHAYTVAFNKDGSLLAAGYANSQIILWSPSGRNIVKILKGHTDAVRVVVFDPDGKVLASAGDDGSIRRWEMKSDPIGHPQKSLRESGDAIFALAFTQNGDHLFSGGADGIGAVWDVRLGSEDFHTYGQTDRITAVAASPDLEDANIYLFSAGRDGTLRVHVFDRTRLVEIARSRGLRGYTVEECRKLFDAALCPALAAVPTATPTPPPLDTGPTQVAVGAEPPTPTPDNQPSASLYAAEASLVDLSSAGALGLQNARFRDNYTLSRFERPFNVDLSTYYPDVDIQSAYLTTTQKWLYFSISLAGQSQSQSPAQQTLDAGLSAHYAIELDMDGDGRGDHLVITDAPGTDWSTSGVSIWEDQNRDVGGQRPYVSDPPQTGDGYETKIFDSGTGASPDLAWSRISPDSTNSVQIALLRSVVNTSSRNDSSFLWTAWASHEPFQPGWFDYNDHFTPEQAVAQDGEGISSLNDLPGLDNTCRYPFGVDVSGDVFCQK